MFPFVAPNKSMQGHVLTQTVYTNEPESQSTQVKVTCHVDQQQFPIDDEY